MTDLIKEQEERKDAEVAFTGTISHLNDKGDVRIRWDKDDPASVEAARSAFNHLTSRPGGAHLAYRAEKGKGNSGERITEFDPNAERILIAPQLVGG